MAVNISEDVLILKNPSGKGGHKLILVKYFWIDQNDTVSLIGEHLRVKMVDGHYQSILYLKTR